MNSGRWHHPWNRSDSRARCCPPQTRSRCRSHYRNPLRLLESQSAQKQLHLLANLPPLRLPSGNPSPHSDFIGCQWMHCQQYGLGFVTALASAYSCSASTTALSPVFDERLISIVSCLVLILACQPSSSSKTTRRFAWKR